MMDVSQQVKLDVQEFIGKCISILGIRGSGKSNTAAVIFEELMDAGVPSAIADIDGEYWGLKERYEILVAGKSENVDLEVAIEAAPEIAEMSLARNIPVVLDISGYLKDEQNEFLRGFLERLWDVAGRERVPYMLGLEEAHEWIPQGVSSPLKEIITRIALRGRKRGLGAMIISQRSAKVEKDVLTQADIMFLHKVTHTADFAAYKDLIGVKQSEVKELVGAFSPGECYFLDGAKSGEIYVRQRHTFHAGDTPGLEEDRELPELQSISAEIIEAMELATKKRDRKKSQLERLKKRNEHLEAQLAESEKEADELKQQVQTLKGIKVQMPEIKLPQIQRIVRAEIKQVVGLASPADGHEQAGGEPSTVPDSWDDEPLGALSFDDLPQPVKAQAKTLDKKLSNARKSTRLALRFLVEREPARYSSRQLASWLDYADHTYKSHPPTSGCMGIIQRDGDHFYADLLGAVDSEFTVFRPDLGDEDIEIIADWFREQIGELS